jgi:hypothetical protein
MRPRLTKARNKSRIFQSAWLCIVIENPWYKNTTNNDDTVIGTGMKNYSGIVLGFLFTALIFAAGCMSQTAEPVQTPTPTTMIR